MEKVLLYSRIALALAGAFCFACIGILALRFQPITLHLNGVLTRAEGIETKLNATLINLDKGTKVWADSAKGQADAVKDLATDAHGTLSEANTAIHSLSGAANTLNSQVAHVGPLLDSAKAATDAITPAILEAQGNLSAATLLLNSDLEKGGTTLDKFNEMLSDPNIALTAKNVAGVSGNLNLISGDFERKFHVFLYPPPCKKWGCVAKYAWPVLKNAPAFGESLYWTQQLIQQR